MSKTDAKFMMYDWDEGIFKKVSSNDIVIAVYTAWNYEFDLYEVETEKLIFSGIEDNGTNSEWLKPYGIRVIDEDGHRVLQDTSTGEIYKAPWR